MFGRQGKVKSFLEEYNRIEEINKRDSNYNDLFRNYQVNPFTRKTLDYVTPKVNERPPKICAEEVPGYPIIQCYLRKGYSVPMDRQCAPETELQRLGWFNKRRGYYDDENYDERFKFTHPMADFIKTEDLIKQYVKTFNILKK